MKRLSLAASIALLAGSFAFFSCSGNNAQNAAQAAEAPAAPAAEAESTSSGFAIEKVELSTPLNADWVAAGKSIYEMKCQSCHKLTDEKLVGPGWKGITERREPGWIVAMTTNPEEMLNSDPIAQKLLEEHLVKMPNQNVSKEEARQLLEYMRSNDGVK